jgi:hypothetical protein
MAVGFPLKTTYANGDVYSASDVNDTNGTLNLLGSSVAYAAGKNKIINGDFGVWQRGTSFSAGGVTYTADRFLTNTGLTTGFSAVQSTFTPGTAPVAGYEGRFFLDVAGTLSNASTGYIQIEQRIEDVRTFAGQTVTLSFWAKGSTTGTINTLLAQGFGTGGSSSVLTSTTNHSITTSWQRFTATYSVPSITGKTIGTNNLLDVYIVKNMGTSYPTFGASNYTGTLSIWGVQLEQGSTATAFQTATGTIQGELAACQRYFQVIASGDQKSITTGQYVSATDGRGTVRFVVQFRGTPTLATVTGTDYYVLESFGGVDGINTLDGARVSAESVLLYNQTQASGTGGRALEIRTNNASAFLTASAEL